MKKCKECCYYTKPVNAPETVTAGCMFIPSEEEDWKMPCCEAKKVYTVAIPNLPVTLNKKTIEFCKWIATLDGFVGLKPEYPHGTLLFFETENQAKIARNLIKTYKGGVRTGSNICEVLIDKSLIE